VVDWVAWDPYACVDPGKPCGGYAELVNRTWLPDWSGFYDHARARYPDKPLMLAEWGVVDNGPPARAAAVFGSVARDLAALPEIRRWSTSTRPTLPWGRHGWTAPGGAGGVPGPGVVVVVRPTPAGLTVAGSSSSVEVGAHCAA